MHLEIHSTPFHGPMPIFLDMCFFKFRSMPRIQLIWVFENIFLDQEAKEMARYPIIHL